MSLFEPKAVKAVRRALAEAGSAAPVVKLPHAVATPEEAARALDVPPGAVVQSLVLLVGERPVLALVAGDRRCLIDAVPRILNLEGEVRRAGAGPVREATGFPIGGVAPVGLPERLPTAIDVSLKRFTALYAPAGDARHVFATTVEELKRLTGGIVSYALADGQTPHPGRLAAKAV